MWSLTPPLRHRSLPRLICVRLLDVCSISWHLKASHYLWEDPSCGYSEANSYLHVLILAGDIRCRHHSNSHLRASRCCPQRFNFDLVGILDLQPVNDILSKVIPGFQFDAPNFHRCPTQRGENKDFAPVDFFILRVVSPRLSPAFNSTRIPPLLVRLTPGLSHSASFATISSLHPHPPGLTPRGPQICFEFLPTFLSSLR